MRRQTALLTFFSLALSCFAAAQQTPSATVKVTGRVVTWQGKPVVGAAVAYAGERATTTAEILKNAPLRTDNDGKFSIDCPIRGDKNDPDPPLLMIAQKGMASLGFAVNFRHKDMEKGVRILPREDTDLGDLVMPEGERLFGRVRDKDGNGMPGVRVVARDLLDNHRALPGPRTQCRCVAVTDQSGIFSLPTTLPTAVALEFEGKGCYRHIQAPVSVGMPLEVTLHASGEIAGRVLDAEGRGVEGALVTAAYERRGSVSKVRSGPGGIFSLPLDYDARYRVVASRSDDNKEMTRTITRSRESDVMRGPAGNLELQLPEEHAVEDKSGRKQSLRVEAYAADGTPVPGIRAAAVWQSHAQQNVNYMEYLFSTTLPDSKPSDDHTAMVYGPQEKESQTGTVRAIAKGYAPATQRDVEWAELEDESQRKPVTVRMTKESSVSGRVVDERTGAPVAGAQVWALPQLDPSQGNYNNNRGAPDDAAVTAADGSFRVGELGEGAWILRFTHKERPPTPAATIDLKAEEHRAGFDLKIAEGARIAGHVTGMDIPLGAKVFLHPLQTPRFGGNSFINYSSSAQKPDNARPIALDGSFEFTGMALGNYLLVIDLPSPPRCGGSLAVPLEPMRVRADGVQRDFDGSADLPGKIRGKVAFSRATPTDVSLAIVAEQVGEDPNEQVFGSRMQIQGPRAFVQPDGSYELRVAPGFHQLRLVDAYTGLLLASGSERVRVPAGTEATLDITAALTELRFALTAEQEGKAMAVVDRIELRHTPKADPKQGGRVQVFGGNDNYDQGIGIDVSEGATELRAFVPEGTVTILARNYVQQIRRDQDRGNNPPLCREEFELTEQDGARKEVTLKIAPPQDLEGEKPKDDPAHEKDDGG